LNNLFLIGGAVVAYLIIKKNTSTSSATGIPLTKHEANVEKLLTMAEQKGTPITRDTAEQVVTKTEEIIKIPSLVTKKVADTFKKKIPFLHGLNEYTE